MKWRAPNIPAWQAPWLLAGGLKWAMTFKVLRPRAKAASKPIGFAQEWGILQLRHMFMGK